LKTEFETSRGEGDKTGFVALTPKINPIVDKVEQLFVDGFGFRVRRFDDFAEIRKYIEDLGENYGDLENGQKNSICMGINFEETSSRKWTYNFNYNVTGNPEYRDIYGFDEEEERLLPFEQENLGVLKNMIKSGAFYLINYIDTEILRQETGDTDAFINAKITQMPTFAYKTSTVYSNLQGNMANLIIFPLLVIYLRFTYSILFEKEKKIA
jgi:ATP-binding cassette subfamily A (ABC1) protein 3